MTAFIVAYTDSRLFVATCERCGADIDTQSTEWPELDDAIRNDLKSLAWYAASLGPNLANHARGCVAKEQP